MRRFPLRARLAIWTGGLAVVVVVLFGIGTAWHLYSEQMETFEQEENAGVIRKFNDRAEAWEIVDDLMKAYFLASPVAIGAAALGGWLIGRRALGPIREIVRTAGQINASSLARRFPAPEIHDEIGDLTAVLNDMFDRLEKSFAQATRFSADASHELRTPLAILRGQIEEMTKEEPPGPRQEALEGLLDQTLRLASITEKLLLLSRADAGGLQLETVSADLSALCENLAEDACILALPHGITVHTDIERGVRVVADVSLLQQALLNLVDNALKYNQPRGQMRVTLRASGSHAVVEIENTGPAIPAKSADRIFDRFVRADPSRARSTGGAGLGLSLVREIAHAHGGTVLLGDASPGWTRFEVMLPLAKIS